ncbi:MAG: GNAT family N-acetyltransferase [Rhodobacteraceae bacterium]|nr:GNAT family N-acetyltransferase [Paracoccaceae bacterium]
MPENRDPNAPVPNWSPPQRPDFDVLEGRWARVERLDPARHAANLFDANRASDAIWDYLPYGPFAHPDAFADWLTSVAPGEDPRFHAIQDLETGRYAGVASYLRIAPEAGSIEVGHINLAPELQRTRAATEAMFLLMKWAFEAGYRRYEWKCNATNAGSRRAAGRLGLSYEGVFRQAAVIKGRNRDTAWFAAIDAEWPAFKSAFESWLSPDNFGTDGRQKTRLADLTRPVLAAHDPTATP